MHRTLSCCGLIVGLQVAVIAPSIGRAFEVNEQAGIGVALRIEEGAVLVTKVLPGTPAAESNALQPDDRIVAVGQGNAAPSLVTGFELAKVIGLLRGEKGTVVRLTIIPRGKDDSYSRVVSLTRGTVKELNVFGDGQLLSTGTKAPDSSFTRLSDKSPAKLSEYRGKIIILEFWASWCGPCVEELDKLEGLMSDHPDWRDQVRILAISVDEDIENALGRYKQKGWTAPLVVWAGPGVLKDYHINGLPTLYVLDQKGSVVAAGDRRDLIEIIGPMVEHGE